MVLVIERRSAQAPAVLAVGGAGKTVATSYNVPKCMPSSCARRDHSGLASSQVTASERSAFVLCP